MDEERIASIKLAMVSGTVPLYDIGYLIDQLEAAEKQVTELLEACELLVNTPAKDTKRIKLAWDKTHDAIAMAKPKAVSNE